MLHHISQEELITKGRKQENKDVEEQGDREWRLDALHPRPKAQREVAVQIGDENVLTVRFTEEGEATIFDDVESERPSGKELIEFIGRRDIEENRELVLLLSNEVASNRGALFNGMGLIVLDFESERPSVHSMGFVDVHSEEIDATAPVLHELTDFGQLRFKWRSGIRARHDDERAIGFGALVNVIFEA